MTELTDKEPLKAKLAAAEAKLAAAKAENERLMARVVRTVGPLRAELAAAKAENERLRAQVAELRDARGAAKETERKFGTLQNQLIDELTAAKAENERLRAEITAELEQTRRELETEKAAVSDRDKEIAKLEKVVEAADRLAQAARPYYRGAGDEHRVISGALCLYLADRAAIDAAKAER